MDGHGTGIQYAGTAQLMPADLAWFQERLAKAATHVSGGVLRVCVEFVSDARMQALHKQYAGDDSTTDVLTFANNEPGAPIDCDIAVCVDEARRRAPCLNHTVAQELLLYALHGMLHAAGFDDLVPEHHAAMHAEEDRILCAIGVGPLFGTDASGGAMGGAAPCAPEGFQ